VGRTRRARRPPWLWGLCSSANQIEQARSCVFAISRLGAVAVRNDNQPSVAGNAPAGEMAQARAHVVGQRAASLQCKAQLHCSSDLVDVLPSRPRSANEGFFDVRFIDDDGGRDANAVISIRHVWRMSRDPSLVLRTIRMHQRSAAAHAQVLALPQACGILASCKRCRLRLESWSGFSVAPLRSEQPRVVRGEISS